MKQNIDLPSKIITTHNLVRNFHSAGAMDGIYISVDAAIKNGDTHLSKGDR
jgi:hypothetical protein